METGVEGRPLAHDTLAGLPLQAIRAPTWRLGLLRKLHDSFLLLDLEMDVIVCRTVFIF